LETRIAVLASASSNLAASQKRKGEVAESLGIHHFLRVQNVFERGEIEN
jgi:hypothetical protein